MTGKVPDRLALSNLLQRTRKGEAPMTRWRNAAFGHGMEVTVGMRSRTALRAVSNMETQSMTESGLEVGI